MNYPLDIRDRAFNAIKSGKKKVEGRVPSERNKIPYHQMKKGDTITFRNESTGEILVVKIAYVHHYSDVRSMLEIEAAKYGSINAIISAGNTVNEGIELYHSIPGYKENILKNGIYAIGLEV